MPIDKKGNLIKDFSQENMFYRPQFQLECRFIKNLVEKKTFSDAPLIIADVGVRFGFDRSWDIFSDQCLQVGFEPDVEECARIRAEYSERISQRLPRERVENVALWDSVGRKTLYIMKDLDVASCFPPNKAFFSRFPDPSPMEVIKTAKIKTTTLDTYCEQSDINFDVLKLDVQGAELRVLKGAIKQLKHSALAVITEVGFVELYLGQPLFAEVDRFMRTQGFILFDLDIRRWRRKNLPPNFDGIRIGQTIWADALYLKDFCCDKNQLLNTDLNRLELIKLAALAEYFSLPDYAMEILSFARNLRLMDDSEEKRFIDSLAANQIISRRYRNEFVSKR